MSRFPIPYAAWAIASVLIVSSPSIIVVARQQTSTETPPTIAQAQARLQANDPAGARAILERVVAASPRDVRAWRLLANVQRQLKDADASLASLQKALDVDGNDPQTMFDLGVTYAMKNDRDAAFKWLQQARATRRVDMTQMTGAAALEPLRADARYAALLPVDADFADPFVEPTTIVREWRGEAANDQFGWIARDIGDVDADGAHDFVTSAPTSSKAGAEAGRIYVYSSRRGTLLWTADGAAGDQLGSGLEAAGDVNRDGAGDVIAAAPDGGYARVYSGRDGKVLLTLRSKDPSEGFGTHADGIGDVNRDGVPDVIVGAPGSPKSPAGFEGRAYIYSGKDGALLLTLRGERAGDRFGSAVAGHSRGTSFVILAGAPGAGPAHTGRTYVYRSLSTTPPFTIDADDTGRALGAMFLSVPGDLDGDGIDDVYASDWANSAKGPSTGRVYVASGRDGHRLFTLTGETAGEGFGTSPSVAGDVNGDGIGDLIVGAWQYAGAALGGGRAYLFSGKDGSLMRTFTCRTPGDTFGFDAVGIGDVNGDGRIDLLVTSGWSAVHGFHSGRVFIVSS